MKFKHLIISLFSIASISAQTELEATEDTALMHISILDKDGIPEAQTEVLVNSTDGSIKRKTTTDISGKFYILLPEGKTYKIITKKYGREWDYKELVDIPSNEGPTEFELTVVMKLHHDASGLFPLKDVNFATGKWDLDDKAKAYLDKNVLGLLNSDKTLKLEIGGHTDDVGDDASNMKLSQLRASAVRDYLFSKGITEDRVTAKGYGETHPVAPNTSPENRAKNRRIEAKTIKLK